MLIGSVRDLFTQVRSGPYAWPGGYPRFYVTRDCEALCCGCVRGEIFQIGRAVRDRASRAGSDAQWDVTGVDVNWENPDLYCGHCSERIESAYADD